MSILSVKEISRRRMGLDQKFQRTYRRVYRVRSDIPNEPGVNVIFASANGVAVPRLCDCYWTGTPSALEEVDTGAFVTDVTPEQDDEDPYVWLVEVTYKSVSGDPAQMGQEPGQPGQTGGGGGGGSGSPPQSNPLTRPYQISWKSVRYQKTIRYDTTGRALVNSAGDLLDPPLEIEDSRLAVRIVRNLAALGPDYVAKFKDAVNIQAFLGVPPGYAKVADIGAERKFENGLVYWELSVEVEVRDWTVPAAQGLAAPVNRNSFHPLYKLSEGMREKIGSDLVEIRVKKGGEPTSDLRPLDANGAALPLPLTPGDEHWLELSVYKRENLNELLA